MKVEFGTLNYIVLFVYLFSVIGIGIYFSKRSGKDTDNYFKAGGRIPGWAAGVSILATTLSAITFMAIPAKAYRTNWAMAGNNIGIILITPIVIIFFIPFFRKLRVTTAYEYLEKRFDLKVRLLASLIFMLFQIGRTAIVIFLPTLALISVTNINPYLLVYSIGIICIISTFLGGAEGVIWCDVIQGFLLMGSAVFLLILGICDLKGGVGSVFNAMADQGKFLSSQNFNFSFIKETVYITVIGGVFNNIYQMCGSQDVVQRFNSTGSIEETNKSLKVNAYLAFLVIIVFYGLGTVLYVYYHQNPGALTSGLNIGSIIPYFILQNVPIGIAGLIIAGIFAASQSTISSSLNSISACYVTDIKKRLYHNVDEKACVRSARIVTIVTGLIGTFIAAYMVKTNQQHLLDMFNAMLGLFGAPVGGVFLLAVFTKRASGTGVFIGIFISVIVEVIAINLGLYFMYYSIIGVCTSYIAGYLFSFIFKREKDIKGLTYSSINDEVVEHY